MALQGWEQWECAEGQLNSELVGGARKQVEKKEGKGTTLRSRRSCSDLKTEVKEGKRVLRACTSPRGFAVGHWLSE